jgi:uncharacterized membrane protein
MPQKSYDSKRRAKEQLHGKWMQAALVCFIASLIAMTSTGMNTVHSVQNVLQNGHWVNVSTTNSTSGLGGLLSFIFAGPITLGVSGYFLKLIRNEKTIIENMFGGFKFFITAFVLNLLITIFTVLWSLLLIIPGIIASYRYSMSYYIMADNPQLSAAEALNESKQMMIGFKFELFKLWCSFLGWFILGLISVGIGFIWIIPYYNAAKANFYQDLKLNLI